jgi:hypothetical protein
VTGERRARSDGRSTPGATAGGSGGPGRGGGGMAASSASAPEDAVVTGDSR